jgi:hypothetical protein
MRSQQETLKALLAQIPANGRAYQTVVTGNVDETVFLHFGGSD